VQKSIKRLKDLDVMQTDGRYEKLTKKERIKLDRERQSLEKVLSGIKSMNRLPDLVFVIDVRKEEIAVAEANKLGIPVIAVVDTNCSPEGIDYVIPGNDDALRAVRLFASRIADAVLEGQQMLTEGGASADEPRAEAKPEASAESGEITSAAPVAPPSGSEPEQAVAEAAPPELSAQDSDAQTNGDALQGEPENESAEVVAAS
jgi:small subunit ribosomal protein S2